MLQLKNITKVYGSGDTAVQALDGVSLAFRHNEFVSILGQSGCGKTTLLNLVGGLDQYTSGDLIINGKSTKNFKARDWDTYRNHTIGFVFQTYNLIPHQSVLNNVELALTLSGVSKAERRRRAKAALERVGLGNHMRKRPSQLSGGQMQRVAIARALVNDPDIILADEPTGALDTETSVQVMDLLKEVASDRLVVMVTHNPELAEQYSTRIIRMLDGKVINDSAPLSDEEMQAEQELEQAHAKPTGKKRREKKPSMSFATSFGLSLKNLFTKKGRTTLTAFAGSIGIIGIALITAVSNGMTTYIDTVQEETLSSYPLTLEATHMDMSTLLQTFMGAAQSSGDHAKDAVYQKAMLYELVNALNNREANQNDLKAFKAFLEKQMADKSEDNELRDAINGIRYGYDLDLLVYTENETENGTIIQRSDTQELLMDLMLKHLGADMAGMKEMSENYGFGNMMNSSTMLWQEILPANDGSLINPLLYEQYDVINGDWPKAYDEIVLVVDKNNEIDDMTLYALGLKTKDEMDALAKASLEQTTIEIEQKSWTYEEIRNKEYRVIFPFDCYEPSKTKPGLFVDLRKGNEDNATNDAGLRQLYDTKSLPLKVVGIIRPKEDTSATILTGNIAYTSALTAHIIERGKNAPVVMAQLENPDIDVTTGLPFKPTKSTLTAEEFTAYLDTLDNKTKAAAWVAYQSTILPENFDTLVENDERMAIPVEQMRAILTTQAGAMDAHSAALLNTLTDQGVKVFYRSMIETMLTTENAIKVQSAYATMKEDAIVEELHAALNNTESKLSDEQRMELYKTAEFILYVGKLDEKGKGDAYIDMQVVDQTTTQLEMIPLLEKDALVGYVESLLTSGELEIPDQYQVIISQLSNMTADSLKKTLISMIQSDELNTSDQTKEDILAALPGAATPAVLASELEARMATYTSKQMANYYDRVPVFSETTYEENLVTLGKLELDSPATINIYASSFENKDVIVEAINDYNKDRPELEQIVYTDYVGLIMSSVTTIINAITYVLIAFVSISLIVSSIMIGVITLISVQERTKEIGILRAIGASKRNVSSMFNAETMIIGFTAGLLGVVITYLLCIPINLILNHFTGIANLNAILPIEAALILVAISVLLTLFAGIIPSRSAAKKDPVVALRTE